MRLPRTGITNSLFPVRAAYLPHPRHRFQPRKRPLDDGPPRLAHRVAAMPCRPPVDGAAAILVVLRHVRRDVHSLQRRHHIPAIVGFVRAQSEAMAAPFLPHRIRHQDRRIGLRRSIGLRQHRVHDEPVPVLHHDMAQVTQLRFAAARLLIEPRIGIGLRCVRIIGTLLTMKARTTAAGRRHRPCAGNSSGWPRLRSSCRPR